MLYYYAISLISKTGCPINPSGESPRLHNIRVLIYQSDMTAAYVNMTKVLRHLSTTEQYFFDFENLCTKGLITGGWMTVYFTAQHELQITGLVKEVQQALPSLRASFFEVTGLSFPSFQDFDKAMVFDKQSSGELC
jgi:hypothetical protein